MWGNFMERAKDLAVNLDKQLNESVGLEGTTSTNTNVGTTTSNNINNNNNNNNIDTNLPEDASKNNHSYPESSFASSAVATSTTDQEVLTKKETVGDAWNDDFDFDDDDNDDNDDNDDKDVSETPFEEESIPNKEETPEEPVIPSELEEKPAPTTTIATTILEENPTPIVAPAQSVPNEEQKNNHASPDGWEGEDDILMNDGSEDEKQGKDQHFSMDPIADALTVEPPTEAPPLTLEEQEPTSVNTTTAEEEPAPLQEDEATVSSTQRVVAPTAEFGAMWNALAGSLVSSGGKGEESSSLWKKQEEQPARNVEEDTFQQPADGNEIGTQEGWQEETDDLIFQDSQEEKMEFIETTSLPQSSPPQDNEKTAMNEMQVAGNEVTTRKEEEEQEQEWNEPNPIHPESLATMSEVEPPFKGNSSFESAASFRQVDSVSGEIPQQEFPIAQSSATATTTTTTIPTATMTTTNIENDPRYQKVVEQLRLREEQLSNKSTQMTELQDMLEQQERSYKQKLADTKEEAKKRILKAKERCEAAEAKMQQMQSSQSADSASQQQIIQALREEGQALAQKQSTMEQAVRAAKGECRQLRQDLESEQEEKEKAVHKINKLEAELKSTKDSLAMARKGESQVGKLEQDLLSVRTDAERKAATILSLQQQVKELTAEGKDLQGLLERTRKEALQEAQEEKKSLRREHHDLVNDLEAKLRTTEREAGVREDALRHEVAELRKRWEDAVRRADALSMDVQSSTAPLLRQLESMERQNRARAANWAELENRLRSELEETVIQNEVLTKERNEFKAKYNRLERSVNEQSQELKQANYLVEEQKMKLTKLEAQVEKLEAEASKREEEYSKVERLANEGVMRVRSEMTQTVVDSEERYRGQIEKLENELRVEYEKRSQLEQQVEQMLENAGMFVPPQATDTFRREAKPKKLREAEGQAEILAGALGFDDTDDDEDDDMFGKDMDRGDSFNKNGGGGGGMNSFAALEQLSSKLRAATSELEALRLNLRESERARESLVEELGESRTAKEKLPFFEAKVQELTKDNKEKALEIQGLQEDIADVREMYRTQLNLLLEEKAAMSNLQKQGNGSTEPSPVEAEEDVAGDDRSPDSF